MTELSLMADQEQGTVVNVEEVPAGDELAVAADPSSIVLTLYDACDFDEDGGTLTLVGDSSTEIAAYLSADLTLDQLTLAAPLTGTWAADTPVVVHPPSAERRALVQLDLDGEAVNARVKHALWDRLPLGSRDDVTGERVALTLDGGDWIVEDLLGQQPTVDGSYIDPDTLPPVEFPPTSDGLPPSVSPTPEVTGGIGALFVRWVAPVNADPLTYDVHISSTSGFAPDPTTFIVSTVATSTTIRKLPLAVGTPPSDVLQYGVTYYFRIVARDADGAALVGAQGGAAMVQVSGPDIAAFSVTAEHIVSGSITGRLFAADIILGSKITTGSLDAFGQITGQRVEMDPLGLRVVTSAGVAVVTLPTDPAQDARFEGQLVAKGLRVSGAANFESALNTIATSAGLTLSSASNDPILTPALTAEYTKVTYERPSRSGPLGDFGLNPSQILAACVVDTATRLTYVAQFVSGAAGSTRVWRYNWFTGLLMADSYGDFQDFPGYQFIGMTTLGTRPIYLMLDPEAGIIYLYDRSQSRPYNLIAGLGSSDAAVGHDGTNIVIAWRGSDGVTMNYWTLGAWNNTAGGGTPTIPRTSAITLAGSWSGLHFVGRGDFGQGPGLQWVCIGYSYPAPVFKMYPTVSNGAASDPTWNWTSPSMAAVLADRTGAYSPMAIGSDGVSRFFTNTWYPSNWKLWAAFTHRDSQGTVHETLPGPIGSLTAVSRALIQTVIPPVPGLGGVDDPDSVRLYTAQGTSTTPPVASALKMEATLAATPGQSTIYRINAWSSSGAAPPTLNNFPIGAPGYIQSQVPRTYEAARPRFKVDGNGAATIDGLIPAGTIVLTAASAAPAGWLLCDGAAVSRTTYAELYNTILIAYGGGNGTSTFNVPNLKGRVPVGLDPAQTEFSAVANSGGAKTHTLATTELPAHNHTQTAHTHAPSNGDLFLTSQQNVAVNLTARTFPTAGGTANYLYSTGESNIVEEMAATTSAAPAIANTGGGGAHNNLQPYLTLNYIIKT